MQLRDHIAKVFGYSFRIALVSIVAIPIWLCAWWFSGPHPAPREFPTGILSHALSIPGVVFLSPGYFAIKLAWASKLSGGIGLDCLVGLIVVWLFWGIVVYCLVQLYRYARVYNTGV